MSHLNHIIFRFIVHASKPYTVRAQDVLKHKIVTFTQVNLRGTEL